MKRIVITGFAFAAILASCGGENKVESETAKEVHVAEVKSTTETFKTVKEGSVVKWMGSHLAGVGAHNGTVNVKSGEVIVNDGKIDNATFALDMTSIHTFDYDKGTEDYGKLVGHLGSDDFFDISKFATASFGLTNIETIEGELNSKVTGNLTILGQERSITFDANISVSENEITIKSQPFTIDRTQWGVEYNKEGTVDLNPDFIISNDITFTIETTVTK